MTKALDLVAFAILLKGLVMSHFQKCGVAEVNGGEVVHLLVKINGSMFQISVSKLEVT